MSFHPGRIKALFRLGRLCEPCARRLYQDPSACFLFNHTGARSLTGAAASDTPSTFRGKYFWPNDASAFKNGLSEPSVVSSTTITSTSFSRPHISSEPALDHISRWNKIFSLRRRRRRRRSNVLDNTEGPNTLPPDASSQLSSVSSQLPQNTLRQQLAALLSLSKPRLTFLMVLTTASAYTLFPVAVSPLATSMSLSPITLLNLTAGTSLSSACANSLNMLLEPKHDAQMSRTRTRPLVRGLISSRTALTFAIGTGLGGVALLYYGVNPTVASLSAANIALYAGVYTPLKRMSVINTWVGAVVGGIPPLMGWAAAAGQATTVSDPTWRDLLLSPQSSVGGWLLAALLFAWQFPHFNAIAYTIRHEYASAGYRMLASFNTRKNALIALRYSLAMFPICVGLSAAGITTWAFVGTSGIVNVWMTREAWRFWKHEGGKGSARALFWASVWQLPLVLVLAMVQKKGLWERYIQGGLEEEELRAWQSEPEDEQEL